MGMGGGGLGGTRGWKGLSYGGGVGRTRGWMGPGYGGM